MEDVDIDSLLREELVARELEMAIAQLRQEYLKPRAECAEPTIRMCAKIALDKLDAALVRVRTIRGEK